MTRTIAENMEFMETLKRSVGSIDAETLPVSRDWEETEASVGIKLPASLKELINHCGHGTWGRDWVLFHPKAAGFQGLRQPNLLRVKPLVDPDFQSFMPGDTVAGWSIIPLGLLPYRKHIFLERKSEETIVYDGDYCEALRTGLIGPAKFIVESLRWREIDLPPIWRSFAEANWPLGMPIFTPNCRRDPDGFYAI